MNMKKINIIEPVTEEEQTLIIGDKDDIKALYKLLYRRWKNYTTNLLPMFLDPPKFSEWRRCYGICIDSKGYFTVVNSDLILALLVENNQIAA